MSRKDKNLIVNEIELPSRDSLTIFERMFYNNRVNLFRNSIQSILKSGRKGEK